MAQWLLDAPGQTDAPGLPSNDATPRSTASLLSALHTDSGWKIDIFYVLNIVVSIEALVTPFHALTDAQSASLIGRFS